MSGEVNALLVAAEEMERRCRRYSRVGALLSSLFFVLSVAAVHALSTSVATYLLHGNYQLPLAAGAAFATAACVTYVLSDVYRYKAVKAARQACVFRRTAETVAEIDRIMAKLEKEIDELEQELKKRDMRESSAD